MYQVIVTAAEPAKYSPTKFVNVAVLVLATAVERTTAEYICEHAEEASDYARLVFVLQGLFPNALIGVGIRPVMTDIMPPR